MVDVQTLSIVVAAAGVFIAAINSIISSRRSAKNDQLTLETRQAQLFMQIYTQWSDPNFAKQYGLVRYKYADLTGESIMSTTAPFDEESFPAFHSMNQFFEGISVLVQRGLIDVKLVEDLFAGRIVWYWERMASFFQYVRVRLNDPQQYDSIEYLYNIMKQRQPNVDSLLQTTANT